MFIRHATMRIAFTAAVVLLAVNLVGGERRPGDGGVAVGPCPGSGNCCIANGTPGCDDATCCNAICLIDPFCCDGFWDFLCADAAAADGVNCPQCQPPPTGACCHDDGTCTVGTPFDCTFFGGTYQGSGTSCTPNLCPQPTGGCCLISGTCTVVTLSDCNALGGYYQGDFTDCTPNPCTQPSCAADINGDGLINSTDLTLLLGAWAAQGQCP